VLFNNSKKEGGAKRHPLFYRDFAVESSNYNHFALKPEPRIILKALLRNAFKIILVVRLIGNCCKLD
jgi:hypothetical protein